MVVIGTVSVLSLNAMIYLALKVNLVYMYLDWMQERDFHCYNESSARLASGEKPTMQMVRSD